MPAKSFSKTFFTLSIAAYLCLDNSCLIKAESEGINTESRFYFLFINVTRNCFTKMCFKQFQIMNFGRQTYWVSVRCSWSGTIYPEDKRGKSRERQNKFVTVR